MDPGTFTAAPIRPATHAEVSAELRRLLESPTFRLAPQLGRLLQYICNKALTEGSQQLTEYTIAVDLFGKPQGFKESKDSSVRVEVHRLRKRLTQHYSSEGADQPLRILIPSGGYTPQFLVVRDTQSQDALEAPPEPIGHPASTGRSYPLYVAIAVGMLVLILGIRQVVLARASTAKPAAVQTLSPQPARAIPGPAVPVAVPFRIMAGYSGPPRADASGHMWGADQYFQGGRVAHRDALITARTNNSLLFKQWRSGEFSYAIPLKAGVYELHLHFVETEYGPQFSTGENAGSFSIYVNGEMVLPNLDIESDTMGPSIADERVLKDIVPASDGRLHLTFEGANGVPFLNALEVLPGTPHQQLPIRLVAQPTPFTDQSGKVWQPDNYYFNGMTVNRTQTVAGTPDPGLFAVERWGHFTYAIPVDTRGRYTVILHFAECYFGPDQLGHGGVGSRVFNLMANGVLLLENFDVLKEAGSAHALTKTFYHIKPTAQGKLNLTFEPVANYALISAIEVLDESR